MRHCFLQWKHGWGEMRPLATNLKGFVGVFHCLINAGTLLVFYLLPSGNRNILYLKLMSIPFVLGIILFANAGEYRIWFEMLPFSLYAMDVVIYGDPLKSVQIPTADASI
jgi:hypothetical protein